MTYERKVFHKKYYQDNKEFGLDIDEMESKDNGLLYIVNLTQKYRNSDFYTNSIQFQINQGQFYELLLAMQNEVDYQNMPKGGLISREEIERIGNATPRLSPAPYLSPRLIESVEFCKDEKIIPLKEEEKLDD